MRFQNNEHSPHHGLFEVEFVVEVEVEVEVGAFNEPTILYYEALVPSTVQ